MITTKQKTVAIELQSLLKTRWQEATVQIETENRMLCSYGGIVTSNWWSDNDTAEMMFDRINGDYDRPMLVGSIWTGGNWMIGNKIITHEERDAFYSAN